MMKLDMPSSGEWKRIVLWCIWVFNLLVSAVYVVLSFNTCDKLVYAAQQLDLKFSNNVWKAPIAAAAMGGFMVMLFQLLSCIILIRKSVHKFQGPGFGYGFIVAWCFVLSFFTLLCGLVMEGFQPIVSDQLQNQTYWSEMDTGAFQGTYSFAYICSAMFLFFFLCLLVFQSGVTKQLGIYEQMQSHKRILEMNSLAAGGVPDSSSAMSAGMSQQI